MYPVVVGLSPPLLLLGTFGRDYVLHHIRATLGLWLGARHALYHKYYSFCANSVANANLQRDESKSILDGYLVLVRPKSYGHPGFDQIG